MIRTVLLAALGAATLSASAAQAQTRPDQVAFRALYKELVETNTTLSVGSCTAAAEKMGARLKAAGYADKDVQVLVPAERPKDGNLVATLAGTDAKLKPIMLLAHLDVVEANRADWERDPFTLIEEGGYFYARGASDDKAMAAVFTDSLIRYKTEGFKPRRGLRLVLTCGEETSDTFDGVEWLLKHHRPLMEAQFALNEGAGGRLDAEGNRQFLGVQAGEKVYQDFTLVTTNPGGHSSRPSKDNAIYHLAAAIDRLAAYDFPIRLNDATKNHFEKMSMIEGGASGAAMAAVAKDPTNAAAIAQVIKDASRNSMMRTTCVATMVDAGHAPNALPQRAQANVNCRILPGESLESVKAQLVKVFADDKIAVTMVGVPSPVSPPPPLTRAILGPIEQVSNQMWPGVPLVPTMSTGATDSRFTNAAGIPSYGLSGMFGDPDGGGTHGLNERIRVRSLYEGRDFLHSVVKLYATQK
ncbi:MAG: M20/M25/M40 family metallo-hydrolase [Phenylobacterium sp.]|uniref:M20/M25/M40 family metallo-hydrolase n=1 Tax=Phenylobacterium sp. TaxID=1871053 RepID=UPI00272FDB1E|nr:M20/M25/M40 family metallo-hydrolase [Phenylobacterium sp.]MDP2009130.1 M20/M25/M40 family metallo-hydrolase [Phenylobacterium sp.]